MQAHRLNCFGSLFYFIYFALKRKRLTPKLHAPVCRLLESEHLKHKIEMPRDHFKSTIATEGRPIWRALPFMQKDEDAFLKLGYSDEFIKWQNRIHNPARRHLLVSENITNSAMLGKRIRRHFESNDVYRALFPETLPDPSCVWQTNSLHVRQLPGKSGSHGEGTFDFLGVGGALQSRHYDDLTEDDLVGRKALESTTIMDATIDYHRLLVGAFDSDDATHEADELVIGNRWSYHDLNSWIAENETWFTSISHSALGGCCAAHPADTPIFPEEFSFAKLMRLKERLGSYFFSCQFLNNPASPENADFQEAWLCYYRFDIRPDGVYVVHEVKDGFVKKDVKLGHVAVAMTVDPNHSGNAAEGRCRHAIVVLGQAGDDFYLLDYWVAHASFDTLYGKIFEKADNWKLRQFGAESVAAQKFMIHHIKHMAMQRGRNLKIVELDGEVEAPDGTMTRKKEWRIRNILAPIFETNRFWIQHRHQDFIGEYKTFPKGKYCDILDATAYAPQILRNPMSWIRHQTLLRMNQLRAKQVGQAYSVGAR
jgi:hypothetical protein